jgi:hypothetical protein
MSSVTVDGVRMDCHVPGAGPRSSPTPVARGLDHAHTGSGARLTVLEHSGRFGHVEQPAQFTRAVTERTTRPS